jgi:hypothetical protein
MARLTHIPSNYASLSASSLCGWRHALLFSYYCNSNQDVSTFHTEKALKQPLADNFGRQLPRRAFAEFLETKPGTERGGYDQCRSSVLLT